MNPDLAVLTRLAESDGADVVDFYEVGARTPRYTIVKARGALSAARKVADKLEPAARTEFLAALTKLKGHLDERKFARAYAARNEHGMLDAIATASIGDTLRPAMATVLRGYQDAATAEANKVGGGTAAVEWGFDLTNPQASAWGYQWAGELIKNISADAKQTIKDAVGRALDADLTRRDATLAIRNVIGLNDRQAGAVERMRSDLLATGTSATSIETKVEAYAGRLLRERASMIARTEIMTAAHAGQREAWDQAADKGLIEKTETRRIWIVTDDDRLCDECEPMDGVEVDFEDEFDDGDPPLHPGCRCTIGLTFDK